MSVETIGYALVVVSMLLSGLSFVLAVKARLSSSSEATKHDSLPTRGVLIPASQPAGLRKAATVEFSITPIAEEFTKTLEREGRVGSVCYLPVQQESCLK